LWGKIRETSVEPCGIPKLVLTAENGKRVYSTEVNIF
jgi:hypothetical protein